MAIGDTLNQNPFGTNYNPEEEERKKAGLAAQGARIGSGGVTQPIVDEGGNIISRGFDFLFGAPTQEQAQKTLETQPTGPAQRENLQAILRGEERPSSVSKAANFLLGPLDNDPNILGPQQEAAQAPSVESALGATPSVTPPVETPSVGAQEQPGAVVSPFLQSPDTPSGLGGPLLDGFNRVNDSFRAPNAPMGQDATRAALGGMTLNEYLNAPAGTEGVSGLRTDPQGRMIPNPAPAAVNNFAPQTSNVGGNFVPMPILEGNPIPMPGTGQGNLIRGPFRGDPAFSNGPATPPPAFNTRPSPLSPDGGFRVTGGNSVGVTQTPGSNLSPFEQASLERQQRIGGTGSFAGDSAAREARIDSRPDFNEVGRDSDRRGGGLSQSDLRDIAQGTAKDATEGQRMRALEIQQRAGLGEFKPEEELTELEKREIESRIRARDEEITKSERKTNFQPRLIDVGGEKAMELTPGYFQRIPKDTPNKTGLQKTIENLEADLKSGRLTQEEHDIAAKNATNLYIGRKDPSTKTGGATGEVSSAIADAIAAGGEEVTTTPDATSTSSAPVRINSPAEYEALPVGTPYIDSQGTETVKK